MKHFADFASARNSDEQNIVHGALRAVREHLGMEVAYFSEFVDGRAVFREVDAPGLEQLIKVGDSQSLDDVYCNHILAGRLPELIPNTSKEPIALSLPITAAVPIGSHVSVPVLRPDGSPYGMFCCLSPSINETLNSRDLQTMRIFADLVSRQLHSSLTVEEESRLRYETIRDIIDRRRFHIAFQPIVSLVTMEMVGFEALCRVASDPYRTPDIWFAEAEAVGLSVAFEVAAIEAALEHLPLLPDGMTLSVNASPACVTSGLVLEMVAGLDAERLVVEITEHERVEDADGFLDAIGALRGAGMSIAIDDAGAGYSGLQQIARIDPQIIKMDLSLTRSIDRDRVRRALASAMISYGRETGAIIVAEGVETVAERDTLRALGANRGQGYYFGRPAPLETILAQKGTRKTSRKSSLQRLS